MYDNKRVKVFVFESKVVKVLFLLQTIDIICKLTFTNFSYFLKELNILCCLERLND